MHTHAYEALAALPDTHPIKLLMHEHERLLAKLDELERAVRFEGNVPGPEQLRAVELLVRFLIDADDHHVREEVTLFPVLRERGAAAAAAADALMLEHDEIRILQNQLLAAVTSTQGRDADVDAPAIEVLGTRLAGLLRDHVGKEDYILYPMAVELIGDVELWREVTKRGDGIGYMETDGDDAT